MKILSTVYCKTRRDLFILIEQNTNFLVSCLVMIFSWWSNRKFLYGLLPRKEGNISGWRGIRRLAQGHGRRAGQMLVIKEALMQAFQFKGSRLYSQFHLAFQHLYPSQMSLPSMASELLARQKSLFRWTGRTHQLRWITSGSHTLTRLDRRRSWMYRGAKRHALSTLLPVRVSTDKKTSLHRRCKYK